MNLITANDIAYRLVSKHLPGMGWSIRWNDSNRVAGHCRYDTRTLTFSRTISRLVGEDEFTNTVLHEIAHALTPGQSHNRIWQRKHVALGGNGQRCWDASKHEGVSEALANLRKWSISCTACTFKTGRDRMTNAVRTRGRCPDCHSPLNVKQNR